LILKLDSASFANGMTMVKESSPIQTCKICGKPVHETEGHLLHDQPYDPFEPPIHAPTLTLNKRYHHGG
jgi:hypothetical protein